MKYTIICLTDVSTDQISIVSQCYKVWREVYEPILAASKEELLSDYFYRCKVLSVVTGADDVPVAFSLHNNFCIEIGGVRDHSYFAPAGQAFMQKIISERQNVMTVEWVTVHPNHRGKFTKIQPAEVIMGLAMELGKHSPYSAVMGFSRMDMKADRVGEKFGVQSFGEIERHNIPCKIMFSPIDRLTAHPFKKVQAVIDELWFQKQNFWPYLRENVGAVRVTERHVS